jgi:hypothetical protein
MYEFDYDAFMIDIYVICIHTLMVVRSAWWVCLRAGRWGIVWASSLYDDDGDDDDDHDDDDDDHDDGNNDVYLNKLIRNYNRYYLSILRMTSPIFINL